MSHLSIIPQKFSFTKPTIYGGLGELIITTGGAIHEYKIFT